MKVKLKKNFNSKVRDKKKLLKKQPLSTTTGLRISSANSFVSGKHQPTNDNEKHLLGMNTVRKKKEMMHSGKRMKRNHKSDMVSGGGDKEDEDEEENDDDDDDDDDEEEVVVNNNADIDSESNENIISDDDSSVVAPDSQTHKKSLEKLRETDPEFYKFLEENDQNLLKFDISDSESENEVNDADDDDDDKVHKPPEDLEVGSDESDFEADNDTGNESHRVITLKMVKQWQEELQNDRTVSTIRTVVNAFEAALMRVSSEEDQKSTEFKVAGTSVFNAVIQLCVLELQPAIRKYLNLPPGARMQPQKGKKWIKLKPSLKAYLGDLLRLLGGVSSTHIVAVLLKHLHQMSLFVSCFPTITRPLLKKLVQLWSSGEETVRVLAFLCILRVTTNQPEKMLDKVLKLMYMAYVRNSKFVSPNTLPGINFMRRSLTEMYALDEATSYQHVFLYIRQLAIHLRNAITLQKKETIQAVYNWQFVHSLHLWAELLGVTANKPQLRPLVYPLVQVIIGTIKLIPTAQYYPLRFHCAQILIQLSKESNTFIPVLPFLLEVLNSYDFNKGHKKVSMKPMDFTCLLRLSKVQLQENGFKDAIIERIYQQLLEYLANESHRISFPDIVIYSIIQLKKFVKTCKVSNYCKKLRQVQEKIEENSRAVENERRKVTFSLNDSKAIDAWESNFKLKGTPLMLFYTNWNKLHTLKLAKRATDNDKLGEFNIPVLKKHQKRPKPEPEGPVELFPSDESDDDNLFSNKLEEEPKKKRGKRGKKGTATSRIIANFESDNEDEDVVEELRLSDLE